MSFVSRLLLALDIWGLLILATLPAKAQQIPSTPLEQAMTARILSEVSTGLQCSSSLIVVQTALKVAQDRIKELETKYEADKPRD